MVKKQLEGKNGNYAFNPATLASIKDVQNNMKNI